MYETGEVDNPPLHPAEPRKRILVADDDADVCALLVLVLKPHYNVTVVPDAETALHYHAKLAFDAIISDFMLPGITGLEFVERVRCAEGATRVPILMISGHGALGIDVAARAAGADAFLDKPFTLEELRATIGSLLAPRMRYA